MKRWLSLLVMLFCVSAVFSNTTPAPAKPQNEAAVAVSDQSATSLQLGLQAAFSEVMIKMSGNPKIMGLPAVQGVSANLTEVVQSYSYVQQPETVPPAKPALMLEVVFDQNALQQLLQTINNAAQDSNTKIAPAILDIKLMITGVKNMNDYTLMTQALHQTPAINSISVISVDPDRVAIEVHLNSDVAALKTALASNNHFKALMTANTNTNETELFYLWVGTPT